MCVYASPNQPYAEVLDKVGHLCDQHAQIIICGDLNCCIAALAEDGRQPTPRSRAVDRLIVDYGLSVANTQTFTRYHQGHHSINDYTLYRDVEVENWRTLPDDSLSDHLYIDFDITTDGVGGAAPRFHIKLDAEGLVEDFQNPPHFLAFDSPASVEANAETLTRWLVQTVETRTIRTEAKPTTYWWTPHMHGVRTILKNLQRRLHRARDPERRRLLTTLRNAARTLYKSMVHRSKKRCWREFCTQSRPWGRPYNVVVKNQKSTPTPVCLRKPDDSLTTTAAEATALLLTSKFPAVTPLAPIPLPPLVHGCAPRVDKDEVADHLRTRSNRSAPGPDGLGYKVLKLLNKAQPTLLANLYTACHVFAVFPEVWKPGRAVFLLKPDKPADRVGSYRPLTMLSTLGKELEYTIYKQLLDHLNIVSPLSDRQYGFRHQRSTEDCIHEALQAIKEQRDEYALVAVVSLDIREAFPTLPWAHILNVLQARHVPQHLVNLMRSYLSARKVECNGQSHWLECGCPMGSILGPLLWNLGYDEILQLIQERGAASTYCYADDTLLIMGADDAHLLIPSVEMEIAEIANDMEMIGLHLNDSKTTILLFDQRPPRIRYDRSEPELVFQLDSGPLISPCSKMKYLGIWLDHRLTFSAHVEYMCEKSMEILPRILAVCRNTFGYSNKARNVILKGTIGAYFKYASTAYAPAMQLLKNRRQIQQVHRRMLLCAGRLYRTVSYLPATVLTGWMPLDLEIDIRTALTLVRKDWTVPANIQLPATPADLSLPERLRIEATKKWQRMWDDCPNGAWTKYLFPSVEARVPSLDFHLAQGLSAHGCFRAYLFSKERSDSPDCACGQPETAAHCFLECPLHATARPASLRADEPDTIRYIRETVHTLWTAEIDRERS